MLKVVAGVVFGAVFWSAITAAIIVSGDACASACVRAAGPPKVAVKDAPGCGSAVSGAGVGVWAMEMMRE